MRWFRTTRTVWALVLAGLAAGALGGVATVLLATTATAQSALASGAVLDVTHSPPLLTVPGESPRFEFDTHCLASGVEDPEKRCTVDGTLYARTASDGSFLAIALQPDDRAGRLAADLPAVLQGSPWLEYYALFSSPDVEARATVPPGGASAPYVSRRLPDAVHVDLGRHGFGSGQRRGERVLFAPWGDGPNEVGLEQGRNLDPIGVSAFDVDQSGSVVILDHANRRLLRWARGSRTQSRTPVSVNGTIADLAVADDGSLYVLETTSRDGRAPLVRRFDDAGRELEAVESAERGPAQIRIGPDGPIVLQRPSNQWMPASVDGVAATPVAQRQRGRVGRLLRSGGEVVVQRYEDELRVALLAGRRIARSWRITSATPLAEVQLAEPLGQRFVVVVRAYDDRSDEFVVLLLDRRGLVSRTTVDSADWAESAPLARFRLVGRDLYRLGSTSSGAFVDRFDLEVR